MRTSQTLTAMYEVMRARFGHRAWWPAAEKASPAERALEICVGAILTQNTNWKNVEKAIGNLRAARCMGLEALNGKPAGEIAELVRPAGYYNVKAKRLKNFVARVWQSWGDDILGFLDRSPEALREELLAINGIGRETADSIILYAAGRCMFVVDAYTCRILRRHRLIGPEADYDSVQELLVSHLPREAALWNDYHAQLVEVGKTYCRPTARCEGCPLEPFDHDPQADRETYG